MDQKSAQERTKNQSIFEVNFKRLPGTFYSKMTSNLEPKTEGKRSLKHPPARVTEKVTKNVKNEPSEIGKILILPFVLWGIYKSHTFLQMVQRSSKKNRKSTQKWSENERTYAPKRDQNTRTKQDTDLLGKCLILGSVWEPTLDQKSIKNRYRKSIEIWTTTKS